jgi:hypothetical protein
MVARAMLASPRSAGLHHLPPTEVAQSLGGGRQRPINKQDIQNSPVVILSARRKGQNRRSAWIHHQRLMAGLVIRPGGGQSRQEDSRV